MTNGTGPLAGVKVLELAGIGALPFGGMMLADMGAQVVRVDRPAAVPKDPATRSSNIGGSERAVSMLDRGRRSVAIDLRDPAGAAAVLRMVERVDVVIESNRPGVAERLGVGPDACLARNPRLVYGRLTGWGQDGPLASVAGHDLNYVSLTGAVHSIGPRGGAPVPPLQILGDFAGGGLLLAYGVACALVEVARSGKGQVIDSAMIDGAMSFMGIYYAMQQGGQWTHERGENLFDGGAHFYNVYETSDGRYVSIASVEPQFYALLLKLLGLDGVPDLPGQWDRPQWPAMRERIAAIVRTKTRDEWCGLMDGTDVCFAPVLDLEEVRAHPHHVARGSINTDGHVAPAPRLSRTPGSPGESSRHPGAHTTQVLHEFGFEDDEIASMRASAVIA